MCQGGFPGLPHVAPYTQWTKSMEDKTRKRGAGGGTATVVQVLQDYQLKSPEHPTPCVERKDT